MNKIEQRIQELDTEKKSLLTQLEAHRARKRFECTLCGKTHAIRDCVVIQDRWYTSPSGCTGGDYWNDGELQIVCPVTDHKSRVHFDSQYKVSWELRNQYSYSAEQQFKSLYKHLFKSVIVSHTGQRDQDNRRWVNTQYFDDHRSRFGLHVKGLDK